MKSIKECFSSEIREVAILGHVHADGDCVGSVMGLYHYLKDNFKELSVDPYLNDYTVDIAFMVKNQPVLKEAKNDKVYDLVILLDISSEDRIGCGKEVFSKAKKTVCIDHHGTNPGFCDMNHVVPGAPATAEVLYHLMDPDKISLECATCLFTGLIHDTGVFHFGYKNGDTFRVAADLVDKGVPAESIILHSFVEQSYKEILVSARIREELVFLPQSKMVYAIADTKLQKEFGITAKNLNAVVADLNTIRGAEVALFMYQFKDGTWKGSLRSKEYVNVADIAATFGGGGHMRASGFSFEGDPEKVAEKISHLVEEQLDS